MVKTDLGLTSRLSYEAAALVAHLDAQPEEDGVALVVRETVVDHLGEVGLHGLEGEVLEVLELLAHRGKVHGSLDVVEIVRHVLEADRLREDVLATDVSQSNRPINLYPNEADRPSTRLLRCVTIVPNAYGAVKECLKLISVHKGSAQ